MWILSLFERPLILGAFIVAAYAVKVITDYTKLRRFSGPFWTHFSHWPHSLAFLGGSCHEWYAGINEKYGPIARVAPQILVTSSPDVWMHVNNNPMYKRSDWYYNAARFEYRRDNVFSQTDNAKHDLRRKQMGPGYSGRENLQLEPAIDERVEALIKLVRSYVSTDRQIVPMDLASKIQYLTLDVISSVGLGQTFNMLDRDEDVDEYLKSSEDSLALGNVALGLGFSWLRQAPFIGQFIAPSPTDNDGTGKMMATCFRLVDERAAKSTEDRSDMLASFIRHGLTGDELRSEALEQIVAGSDTTAGAIRGTLLHLMTNARVYLKLRDEIDNAIASGLAPATGKGLISTAETRQLPYLQAVIREALRVWPPVANIFPRDVPAGGDTVVVDGKSFFLPGGVCIGYSAYGMHHSEKIYGKDAKAFRPERWLEESDTDKLTEMTRTNDLIFGYGRFQCLGKPVAQMEIGKTIFELFRNFDLALLYPTHPWDVKNNLGLFAITNLWVQVTERAPATT